MGCASRGTVRRDAAALNATLAARRRGPVRVVSVCRTYSARERNRNELEGCVGVSLSYRVLSSPLLCVLALPPPSDPPSGLRLGRFYSLSHSLLYSPFRASLKNLSSRSNSRTARRGDCWRRRHLKFEHSIHSIYSSATLSVGTFDVSVGQNGVRMQEISK